VRCGGHRHGIGCGTEDVACIRQQRLTRTCQDDTDWVTLEEREAKFVLEATDLLGEGGLRNCEAFSRPAHTARFGDRDEIPKVPQLHSIFSRYRIDTQLVFDLGWPQP